MLLKDAFKKVYCTEQKLKICERGVHTPPGLLYLIKNNAFNIPKRRQTEAISLC